MHFDIWALHLETMSPELQYEEERSPSWVAHMGWVSELQVGYQTSSGVSFVGSIGKTVPIMPNSFPAYISWVAVILPCLQVHKIVA